MNNTVKNIFGVATAIVVLLGFGLVTDPVSTNTSSNTLDLADTKTEVTAHQQTTAKNATLADLNNGIVEIAEQSNPAVVTVRTEVVQEQRVVNPFSQFFGNPGQGETRERIRRGLGSGVIVSEDGYILTNNHVIENASEIKVRLFDGDEVDAELVGADPQTDIAVLKVNVENAPTLEFGNSDELRVGSFVLAIGSPLQENLAHTVSFGIVSAKGRNIGLINQGQGYEDFIQTDAAINPGNSGGALVDMNGELIGINSAIASRSGGNDGIGFSIPSNLAKRIMDDLIEDGAVSRGYLGIYFAGEMDRTMARAFGLDDTRGIIIGRVEDDGPADKAGLMQKDIILSVNGNQVKSWDSFRSLIAAFQPGEEVEFEILRDGDRIKREVTLGERPNEETASANNPGDNRDMDEQLGFAVTDITNEIAQQLQLENEIDGVIVREVRETSNAYERGLRRGMIITEVVQQDVNNAREFYDLIEKEMDRNSEVILLTVRAQDNLEQYIAFEL